MEQKPKKYISVSDSFKKKIAKRKTIQKEQEVDDEWALVAEFGLYFGWEAVKEVLNDDISKDLLLALVLGARKVRSIDRYEATQGMFLAHVSTKSKKPADTFMKVTKKMRTQAGYER